MDAAQVLEQITEGKEGEPRSKEYNDHTSSISNHDKINFQLPKLKHYKWWLRVTTYILFLLAGQTIATLLGRLYYDKGGNSKWMATLVQSAGFPILIPLLFFFPKSKPSFSPKTSPSLVNRRVKRAGSDWVFGSGQLLTGLLVKLTFLYLALGLILTGDNLMYSYGLLYLPVSTYSLLCGSQLAFNAIFSFFINSQKFTALVLNSLVLLTISACLLAINADNEDNSSSDFSKGKYIIGFLCTIGASATYSLMLSLMQISFEKVIKNETFKAVLDMQIYPSIVASCACVIGLFVSGEWRSLKHEMRDYKKGKVSYVMTLVWTAISWQISSVGLLGLIFEVNSLFSNVISTLGLPLVPVFAVVFFHDKMNGVKVISLVLAIWGFLSYIYQHYLDDVEDSKVKKGNDQNVVHGATIEVC